MKNLARELLLPDPLENLFFESPINQTRTRGNYNPTRFLLRLRKDIHIHLMDVESDIFLSNDLSKEVLQASSIYLHENIHWWQHVGSNFGLISSLIFPCQTHQVYSELKSTLDILGPYKSIQKLNGTIIPFDSNPVVNTILNTWHDLEIFSDITFNPQIVREVTKNIYFESVGHSFHIAWSSAIAALANIADVKFKFLPNVDKWNIVFEKLNQSKVEGYYFNSPIKISPLGIKAIYEGQAIFSQMQYLHRSFNQQYNLEDFANEGMLTGIYSEAFDLFLKVIQHERPSSPIDPLVGLFLLICDISINPSNGFPFDIYNFEEFIRSNDPGFRFLRLCNLVREKFPEFKTSIKEYSKSEYIEISTALSEAIGCAGPFKCSQLVVEWMRKESSIKELLLEEAAFNYKNENLPIRLFFSKYLSLQADKFENPQLFCWPGACLSGTLSKSMNIADVKIVFNKHRAPFMDGIDGDVHPTIMDGISHGQIMHTFNQFYSANCLYDLVYQWIGEAGPFNQNFKWLTTKYSQQEIEEWLNRLFANSFGRNLGEFTILK